VVFATEGLIMLKTTPKGWTTVKEHVPHPDHEGVVGDLMFNPVTGVYQMLVYDSVLDNYEPRSVPHAWAQRLAGVLVLILVWAAGAAPAAAQSSRLVDTTIYAAGASAFLDGIASAYAIEAGATEANPVMRRVSDHPLKFAAVKGAGDAAVVFALVKTRKRHPRLTFVTACAYTTLQAYLGVRAYRAWEKRH
jgi:hypothetical protein